MLPRPRPPFPLTAVRLSAHVEAKAPTAMAGVSREEER